MHTIGVRKILMLRPREIKPPPEPLRCELNGDRLFPLRDSIAAGGLIQPLPVRKDGRGYRLISGERRLKAAMMAGLRRVPCVVHRVDDTTALFYGLTENLQFSPISFFEEARCLDMLTRKGKMSFFQTATRLGISQSELNAKLQLLRLEDRLCERIEAAGLTEQHARALLQVPRECRAQVLDTVIVDNLTVRQTEEYVLSILNPPAKREETVSLETPAEPPVTAVEDNAEEPVRKIAIGDVRLFTNSLSKLVDTLRSGGVKTEFRKSESDRCTEYRIRIKKESEAAAQGLQLKISQ